jgi:hypothetical protein
MGVRCVTQIRVIAAFDARTDTLSASPAADIRQGNTR